MLNRCIKIHSLHAREKGEGQGGTHKYLNQRTKDNMQSRMESQWHQVVAEDEVIKDGLEKESETGINICLEEKVQVLQPVKWHSKGTAKVFRLLAVAMRCWSSPAEDRFNGILKPILFISVCVGMIGN